MPRTRKDCPLCGKRDICKLSNYMASIHRLSSTEKRVYLKGSSHKEQKSTNAIYIVKSKTTFAYFFYIGYTDYNPLSPIDQQTYRCVIKHIHGLPLGVLATCKHPITIDLLNHIVRLFYSSFKINNPPSPTKEAISNVIYSNIYIFHMLTSKSGDVLK